ncbi:hypothetical protein Ae168Ps1_2236 [Pseudonocardia sp. Ae168_Ps1]|nr:hypothetical protein Ae150APs1_2228 [Pseudonocardia sp. Ae150A_Ps1]OLL79830.1 hypothetical protein Ae168Ps1_2236 [Pseudonocardia sp. Ae168_Ps1]OLL86037.1 hypothetical protein Ae263Ps1_3092c [Pseudonocardia sp. Ae263_Ps1]OLL93933.1 hypothetical protein Ae356Ps1_3830 [Pseudonocardia sp. Ae356_Ps1]
MALANILSEMPDLLERTLSEHTPDDQGYCWECRDASGISATWACVTRELAEQARSMNGTDDAPAAGTVAGRRRAREFNAAGLADGRHRSP